MLFSQVIHISLDMKRKIQERGATSIGEEFNPQF